MTNIVALIMGIAMAILPTMSCEVTECIDPINGKKAIFINDEVVERQEYNYETDEWDVVWNKWTK